MTTMMMMMMMMMMMKMQMMILIKSILHIEGGDRGVKRQAFFMGPPGKRIKEELKEERKRHDIWDRRFQKP
jgi:hypothetical protein